MSFLNHTRSKIPANKNKTADNIKSNGLITGPNLL